MKYVIRCHGLASQPDELCGAEGQYLRFFDPEFKDGRGTADWTPDIELAIQFDTAQRAFDVWRLRSKLRPTRSDGRANRPLTAFSVSVQPAEVG